MGTPVQVKLAETPQQFMNDFVSFGSACIKVVPTVCTQTTTSLAVKCIDSQAKETKDSAMYFENGTPIETQQRVYLRNRLSSIYNEKNRKLRQEFGLEDDEEPKTLQETIDRLSSGKFTPRFDKKPEDIKVHGWMALQEYVRWHDPSVKADEDGYATAEKALSEAKTKATDVIIVKSPEDGLAALEAFEAS